MPSEPHTPDRAHRRALFDTKSHSWREVGLARQISQQAARRAWRQLFVIVPAMAAVLLGYHYRHQLFGLDMPVRIATVALLVILGWALARDVGRAAGPALFRRLDPGTAGTVGFLIRLLTIVIALLAALNVAGLPPRTLFLGGAFTAVIFGLAAQQTLGNLIAGTVLLSARPFRVGDRVRLQGGPVGGRVEGVVSSLGLLYLTLAHGEDSTMVPNSVVLSLAVMPVREPDSVDLRARLRPDVRPSEVQELLERHVTTALRGEPDIILEEIDDDEVVVRIAATPQRPAEGRQLADQILSAVAALRRNGSNGDRQDADRATLATRHGEGGGPGG
ncbi:MAG TPA: mechanosensitive ion channel family protein [Solirubrobacteraceae bacterium]|jgi:small conductance mechanosensitive channel|nr:mechanosensitive ion channel family protein [Solirubrobacteraceae bacterium]